MNAIDEQLNCGIRLLGVNGLPSELTTLLLTVNVGFSDENKENIGISHTVEHLCFSNNLKASFVDIRNQIASMGGSFNGMTNNKSTIYKIEVLNDYVEEAISILADIVFCPQFSNSAVEYEKKILYTETGQFKQKWLAWFYEKGWFRHFNSLLNDMLWNEKIHYSKTFHQYDNIMPDDLRQWHEKYYFPENMALIVSGNMSIHKLKVHVEKTFSKYSSLNKEQSNNIRIIGEKNENNCINSRISIPFSNESLVAYGVWLHNINIENKALYDLLTLYLENKSFDLLRLKHNIAYSCWVINDNSSHYKHLILLSYVKKGLEEKTITLLKGLLESLKQVDINDQELQTLKNKLLGDFARKNANPGWYAFELERNVFDNATVKIEDYPLDLKKITIQEFQKISRQISNSKFSITFNLIPLCTIAKAVVFIFLLFIFIITVTLFVYIKF